jgi:hypothetical protein
VTDWQEYYRRKHLAKRAMRKAAAEQELKGLTDEERDKRARQLYRRMLERESEGTQ